MNIMLAILNAFALPLAWLNALGGIVAGLWLAILGEWGTIGWGFAFMFFSVYGLSIAMMPAIVLALPAGYLFERGPRILAYPFVFVGMLYNTAVITVWCGWTLAFFVGRADAGSLIPVVLWAYGAATGPLGYMTQKEGEGGGDNTGAVITTYFAQVGFVGMVLAVLLGGVTILDGMFVLAFVMLIGTLFQFAVAVREERERKAVQQGIA